MEQQILITMSPDELLALVKKGVREVEKEKINQVTQNRSYSINQAAKELGRSFATVKNLIQSGQLKTTADGRRIPAQELNNYMSSST